MATIAYSVFSLPSLRTTLKAQRPAHLPCPNFIQPNLTLKFPRLGISYAKRKESRQAFPVVISCSVEDNSEAYQVTEGSSGPNESHPGATIDLKLPRRSLLVHFTCNSCGERSQKLINRLAYEKGTVFVQCTGCSQYHKLVDNLNLVVEYDFREEKIDMISDTNQV
ncbi:hypothetical protein L2E82_13919 [Cichorium intybus]|uniref:Uncharacterized protein n=1 Tax=Cichorium intybus TaxID=13427 RepID=A0ACB9EYW4_CICIN|nr:hypothetical protein L1887_33559 [Cichorium endivia]KAI3763921.1 hypothetical protein L2E82_13919 [Cichorium intybus]